MSKQGPKLSCSFSKKGPMGPFTDVQHTKRPPLWLQVPPAALNVSVRPCVSSEYKQTEAIYAACPASIYPPTPVTHYVIPAQPMETAQQAPICSLCQDAGHSAPDSDWMVPCPNSKACRGKRDELLRCKEALYDAAANQIVVRLASSMRLSLAGFKFAAWQTTAPSAEATAAGHALLPVQPGPELMHSYAGLTCSCHAMPCHHLAPPSPSACLSSPALRCLALSFAAMLLTIQVLQIKFSPVLTSCGGGQKGLCSLQVQCCSCRPWCLHVI